MYTCNVRHGDMTCTLAGTKIVTGIIPATLTGPTNLVFLIQTEEEDDERDEGGNGELTFKKR
jgi:hypothetical protein